MADNIQSHFAEGLLDRARPPPIEIAVRTGATPLSRYSVYRNNVAAGLVQALAVRFPVTEKIVGSAFFAAMARAFAVSTPPRSPVLLDYGVEFPAYIAGFAPAGELPYMPDVARLENARMKAYHAADVTPIEAVELGRLNVENVDDARVRFHPSATLVRSQYPVHTIWGMNDGELPLGPVDCFQAEDVLVVRSRLRILMHRLPSAGAVFLSALAEGRCLADASEAAFAKRPDFDLSANLVSLVQSGALAAVIVPAA